jgi:hypothetical protein
VLGQHHRFLCHGSTMSTFGLPLYLAESECDYFKAAAANNVCLLSGFGWLLEAMIETLESVIRAPITFDPRLALPGFHIFTSSDQSPYNGGVWHVDVFRYAVSPEPLARYSATLLLGDAQTSYGIDYKTDNSEQYFPHQIGSLTVFGSSIEHRVAAISPTATGQFRVTLQAHVWAYPRQAIAFW